MLFFVFFSFSVSFDKYWCEPPLGKYRVREDADLIQVQLITRHGARTPLHISPAFSNIWQCNYTELKHFNNGSPMNIHVSQGDSIFLGDCHVGQLIQKGSDAITRLGKHLHDIYIDRLKFLPEKYRENIIKFRSTLTHRTLHSSLAFIKGFYPNGTFIKIEVSDKYIDPWRRSSQICPKLKEMIENVRNSKEYLEKFKENITILEKAAKAIGSKTKSAPDIVMAARCNSMDLHTNATELLFDSAAILKAQQQKYLFMHSSVFPLMFSFPAGEIANAMIERYNGNSSLRFIHWSAHDGNIFGFLGYFGVGSDKLPPYGSYILLELWRFKRSGEFFVRMIFNGKALKIPRFGNAKFIPFDDFIAFIKSKMPRLNEDCNFTLQKFKKASVFKTDE